MVHLLIAYELLLLVIGVLTLTLLIAGRGRRPYLTPFLGFYSIFFTIFLLTLIRAYLLTNMDNTSPYFIYMSHGVSTLLNYLLLIFGILTLHRLIGFSRPAVEKVFTIVLIASALLMISPLSLVYLDREEAIQLKVFFYISTIPYIAALAYMSWYFLSKMLRPADRKDRIVALLLGLLSLTGLTETIISFIEDLSLPKYAINSTFGAILISSIPYALLSLYMITILISDLLSHDRTPDAESLKHMGYSPREIDVIKLILKGHPNGKIAEELCISMATVKTHINNIFRKSEVENRFELARKLEKH